MPDRPGAAMTLFSQIAAKSIAMDMIVQNIGAEGHADISFTVVRDDLPATLKAAEQAVAELGAEGVDYDDEVSKISIVGLGMATQTGVAEKMFHALAEKGINIEMISTSPIKISVLVHKDHAVEALRTLHQVFSLQTAPTEKEALVQERPEAPEPAAAADLLAHLQGMEELIIDDVTLDQTQSRITIVGVPDTPGLASQVFQEIADGGIVVDMIVQSFGRQGHANLSFTVPRTDLDGGLKIAADLAQRLGCPPPTSCEKVARLSVYGVGMRSHTGVASRMFNSLSEAGINVDMISTSEVQVSVVVDDAAGEEALRVLRKEFADLMIE
jgi:aspartate kinase